MLKKTKYVVGTAFASLALLFSVAAPQLIGNTVSAEPAPKVFVCKYVGIPGVNERLQTGQNPISVSENAIKDYQGVGSYFNDKQGRSYVLAEDIGQDEPNVSECPQTENTPVTPAAVTFTDPTCSTKGSYTIPSSDGVEYSVNDEDIPAGTYSVENGASVTVRASATEGAEISEGATTEWTNTFTAPTNCGQVLGEQTVAPQVTAAPTGGVNAGAGGASNDTAAIIGLVGSVLTIGLGLVVRKFTN